MSDALKKMFYQCQYPKIIEAVSPNDTAERQLLRMQAEKEMQIKRTFEISRADIETTSDRFTAEYLMARLHYLNDDYETARNHFLTAQINARSTNEKTRATLGLVACLSSAGRHNNAIELFTSVPSYSEDPDLDISLTLMKFNLISAQKEICENFEAEIYRSFSTASKLSWLFFQQRLLFCLINCLIIAQKKVEAKALFPVLQSMIDPDISSYFAFLVNSAYAETGLETITPISIDKASQTFKFAGRELSFQGAELPYRLLCALAESPKGVHKLDIIRKLWPNEQYDPSIHDNRFYNLINRIRKMIEKEPEQPFLLISSREGYKLTCSH